MQYTNDQFKSATSTERGLMYGGQPGLYPDSGTFGSGYDYVSEKEGGLLSKKQLEIIKKHFNSNILFRNILLKIYKNCAKKFKILTPQKIEEGWKDLLAAGAIGASAIAGMGFYNIDFNKLKQLGVSDYQIKQLIDKQNELRNNSVNKNNNINSSSNFFSTKLINYIKSAENGINAGWNKNKNLWFPHKSPEGGMPTIAYGHKIKDNIELSKYKKGISNKKANELLISDLNNAKTVVYNDLNTMLSNKIIKLNSLLYPDNKLKLNNNQEEMLIDYAFNLGTLKKFPKFTQAVLDNDIKKMNQEYERTFRDSKGIVQKLGRNKLFKNTFLN